MAERFICIHGHFYKPPRGSPWLEEVEFQESAQPYHGWNERVIANATLQTLSHELYILIGAFVASVAWVSAFWKLCELIGIKLV